MANEKRAPLFRTTRGKTAILQRARDPCSPSTTIFACQNLPHPRGNQLIGDHQYQQALRFYRQGLPLARQWQNWGEIERLLDGIDTAMENLHLNLTPAHFRDQSFELLPQPQH
jgi:hypothetical protein